MKKTKTLLTFQDEWEYQQRSLKKQLVGIFFWVKNGRNEQIMKVNNQINRLQNIKGLIQVYIGLNKGKWVNTKGILGFIKPWNL